MDESPGDAAPPPLPCEQSETFDLEPRGVRVMVAIDGSHSMQAFWPDVGDAVVRMMRERPGAAYGLHMFWSEPVQDLIDGIARLNFCGQTQHRILDIATDQVESVPGFMGAAPPGPGNQLFDLTPVVDPLNHYLSHTTSLEGEDTTNYLVLISDGNDNCFGTAFAGAGDKNLAYEKLAVELGKKRIRILPIGFDAKSDQLGASSTNFDVLDRLARFGGTGLSHALVVDDPSQFAQALSVVERAVRPCRFRIPAALDPTLGVNPFELTFFADGQTIARDRTGLEGWDFVEGVTSEVELYGAACEAVRDGAHLTAHRGCSSDDVCGRSASKVVAKRSAALYLLDSSASMANCSNDAFLGCVPAPLGGGGLTLWGVATQTIGASIVAPINDHVEFGLQEFPAIGTGFGACEVGSSPEVAPGDGTEITMLGTMLADLPTGMTPLVTALEQVAGAPGPLAATGVDGAVIVLSDGGNTDSCGGANPAQAIDRLGDAAASLAERGVRTYAIRFGPRGADFAEQDAQLRAIVANGGTAQGDPNDASVTPYLEAPDQATLAAVLAEISDRRASCTLAVDAQGDDFDKDRANLYLDGEAIPFAGSAGDGWRWVDTEQTEIELLGDACEHLKTQRIRSIVLEFGCAPIVVQ